MTPEEIRTVEFDTVRRGGYESQEVDAFLDEAMVSLHNGDGRIGPAAVRDVQFTLVKRGGYDTAQVDAFLDRLMVALDPGDSFSASAPAAVPGPSGGAPLAGEPADAPAVGDAAAVVPDHDDAAPSDAGPPDTVSSDPAPADHGDEEPNPAPSPRAQAAPAVRRGPRRHITAAALASLVPPTAEGEGYDRDQVDHFLGLVVATLETFEAVEGVALERIRSVQYLQGVGGGPQLLTGDQVRCAGFGPEDDGGYERKAIDAAVKRLAETLDHHWLR